MMSKRSRRMTNKRKMKKITVMSSKQLKKMRDREEELMTSLTLYQIPYISQNSNSIIFTTPL